MVVYYCGEGGREGRERDRERVRGRGEEGWSGQKGV